MNPIHNCFQKISPGNHFSLEIKGHNSHDNWWILPVIELDLYFMIMYLCMKYESNTPMFSKDIARKPFFVRTGRTYVRTYVRTDKGDAICPPPHYKWPGHNNKGRLNILVLLECVPKNNFLISQPKPMLWVLKRTVSMRGFF